MVADILSALSYDIFRVLTAKVLGNLPRLKCIVFQSLHHTGASVKTLQTTLKHQLQNYLFQTGLSATGYCV